MACLGFLFRWEPPVFGSHIAEFVEKASHTCLVHRKRVKTVTEHHFRPFFGHWRKVDFHGFWTVLTLFGLGDFVHLQEWLILPLQILKDFWPKKKVVRMSWEARNNSEMGVAVSLPHVLDVFESFFFFFGGPVFSGFGRAGMAGRAPEAVGTGLAGRAGGGFWWPEWAQCVPGA